MRLRHPDGSTLHLAYCSNVHPADDLDGVAAQLERYAGPVRERLGVAKLGVGLWVAAPALRVPEAAERLRAQLSRLGLEVVTLNGFPYRAFHAPVVKRDVYLPSWAEAARLEYTLELARLLARLLPDDVAEGSVSTLPLGWREGWGTAEEARALAALERLAEGLAGLEDETGRRIRVALEPEPGCRVETVAEAAAVLGGLAPRWIGVCLDACHLAVQFEDPAIALEALADAGVGVVKGQVSSALAAGDATSPEARELLAEFSEPRFLHQVRARVGDRVEGVDDIPEALAGGLSDGGEMRVHFHVPVHVAERTTQGELERTLAALVGGPEARTHHLEVETYTWGVLPGANGDGAGDEALIDGLASELAWTRDRLLELGAREVG